MLAFKAFKHIGQIYWAQAKGRIGQNWSQSSDGFCVMNWMELTRDRNQ